MAQKGIMQVWLYDNVIIGNNHLSINSGLFDIAQHLCECNKPGKVTFYGDASHLQVIKKQVEQIDNIEKEFVPIDVVNPKTGMIHKILSWAQKLKKDRKEFREMLKAADEKEPDLIILNTLIPLNFKYFIKQISRHAHHNFLFILHGEVEYYFSEERHIKSALYKKHYKYLFRNTPENLKIITLNNFTKKQIISRANTSSDQILHIPHPLPPKKIDLSSELNTSLMNIIFFGVANKRKGAHHLNELSSKVSAEKISLRVLGRTEIVLDNNVHLISKNNKAVPQKKYESEIKNAHYSVSFLKKPEYLYRVSGSLLDSVIYQLPLFALDHPTVRELFDQGGNIGYICQSVEEMASKINDISARPAEYRQEYLLQRKNLGNLKKLFTPAAVAQELKNVLL